MFDCEVQVPPQQHLSLSRAVSYTDAYPRRITMRGIVLPCDEGAEQQEKKKSKHSFIFPLPYLFIKYKGNKRLHACPIQTFP
jgi:hypothetical protein